jgi:type I restriction-modification system DNA methylase subunit
MGEVSGGKMSNILSQLKLTPDSCFDGLVRVSENLPRDIPLTEKRVIQNTLKISNNIDFIFFRRFTKDDVRTSQAVAYIIDNTSKKLTPEVLARLHHTLWLNGTVPLLYIDSENSVDILSCAAKPVAEKAKDWTYNPLDAILANAENIKKQIKRFSASRLADGTFWEDRRNKDYINTNKSAHNILLEKIKRADKEINGESNPVARRLLLITLLVKYLEDRGVFNSDHKFFSRFTEGAKSFYYVLKNGTVEDLERLLKCLESKFNGDIFLIKDKQITQNMIKKITNIVSADIDANGQLYFWDIYNFEHIPVEVISHIYQHFTEKGQGAVFTPILLVNLMLDQVMPLERIKGDEKIFDPTCGSGIFLVSAFRRLIYVNQQKNNKWLTPQALVELLKNSIFGVELQEEAAYITSFSLALAVCDALQPDIIWHELQFEKTVEHNIFIGDFGKRGKDALKASKSNTGFDIILGNAPFIKELTPAIIEDLNKNNKTIPDKQLAYYVLIASVEKYLSESGKICMIQPYGFLYNARTTTMRCNFFDNCTVDKIFDFISINGLFHDANTKAIAVLAKKKKPSAGDRIVHLTFRRTVAINEKICFELDYYDYHSLLQKEATDKKYTWKANLLGGGRLVKLAKRLAELPTIQEYTIKKKWFVQVGYFVGEQKNDDIPKKKRTPATWLFNMPLLVPEALTAKGINYKLLDRVQSSEFERPRTPEIYQAPLMVIEERDTLYSGLWESGFLAYTKEFIGIKVKPDEDAELKYFYSWFTNNNDILCSCLHLCGGRMLVARATATQKEDIMKLPYPDNGIFDLVPWEKELLDDIRNYMAEYVRIGQNSELLKNEASEEDLQHYSQTFLRLMNKTYPNLKKCKERQNNDFRLIAFSFAGNDNALSELDDSNWLETLSTLIEKEKKNDILRTQRVIRIYTGDILIIVKPNRLRYWIRSTAIRDVDDVIIDIFKGEK